MNPPYGRPNQAGCDRGVAHPPEQFSVPPPPTGAEGLYSLDRIQNGWLFSIAARTFTTSSAISPVFSSLAMRIELIETP